MGIERDKNDTSATIEELFRQTNLTHRSQLKLIPDPNKPAASLFSNKDLIGNLNSLIKLYYKNILKCSGDEKEETKALNQFDITVRQCLSIYCSPPMAKFIAEREHTSVISVVEAISNAGKSRTELTR